MIARSPAWIVAAGVVIAQATGAISTVGSVLIGVDNSIKAAIDLKKLLPVAVPQFPQIKPVVVPPPKKAIPTKAAKR